MNFEDNFDEKKLIQTSRQRRDSATEPQGIQTQDLFALRLMEPLMELTSADVKKTASQLLTYG